MSSQSALDKLVMELHEARFNEFNQNILRRKSMVERTAKFHKERLKQRRNFLMSIGTDMKKFDAAVEKDNREQEAELKSLLEEFRPQLLNRPPSGASVSKDAAIRSQVLAESGNLILPVFASSIMAADRAQLTDQTGPIGPPVAPPGINSGWVFPDNPSNIRIAASNHNSDPICYDDGWLGPLEFWTYFTFVPATTANYEMTAVIAFHGFYVLRSDDSWWNCRDAEVKLTVQMNVNQYSESGWHDFPALLDVEKDNADEVTSFDRTFFFDYTTGLRAGDPVVVTIKGDVGATCHGGGAYAELNFKDGTANYIQPLFLSVQQV
jgi:hypothetical protein